MNGDRAEMREWMRLFVALGEQPLPVQALAARLGTTEGVVATMLLAGAARGVLETETLWRLARPDLATGAPLCVALGHEALPIQVLAARLCTTVGLVTEMLLDASACGAVETETAWRLAWPQWAAAAQAALAAHDDGEVQSSR